MFSSGLIRADDGDDDDDRYRKRERERFSHLFDRYLTS